MDAPTSSEAPKADTHAWPSRGQARYSLFVLTIVVMFTVLDRQVLALLIDPIKADFGISDTQAALLLGAAFSITYGIARHPDLLAGAEAPFAQLRPCGARRL